MNKPVKELKVLLYNTRDGKIGYRVHIDDGEPFLLTSSEIEQASVTIQLMVDMWLKEYYKQTERLLFPR